MSTALTIADIVATLSFTKVIWKLVNSEGWDNGRAERAVENYKKFLILAATKPELELVPGADTDKVWHTHILFTRQYREDCDTVFGEYLDHTPWTGEETSQHCNVQCRRKRA